MGLFNRIKACFSNPKPQVFQHGVGSFDPIPDSVLLWTRISVAEGTLEVSVTWELAEDDTFNNILQRGAATTAPERDYTLTVNVSHLAPCTRYCYRFACCGQTSPTGYTKTLAAGRLEEMMFAVVCCANYGFGYFHVYDVASRVDNLDFVLHVGDYIYEYPKYDYPEKYTQARHGLRPKKRLENLGDFRERYACYRTDPALQEMHRKVPMIYVWDDHDVRDNCFMTSSEDFEGTAEEFQAFKYQAIQAAVEWVPVRGMGPECINPAGVHRIFHFGDLASLILVENRISNKTEPPEVTETSFYKEVAKTKRRHWDRNAIMKAKAELLEEMKQPGRHMIGDQQLHNVAEAVEESVAAGAPWQFHASQVVLGQIKAPKLVETLPLMSSVLRWVCKGALSLAISDKIAGPEAAQMARMYLGMGQFGVVMNPDAWDGYQEERQKVLNALNIPGSNPIVLGGDSHNAWAQELMDVDGHRLGVEFDAPATTAIGAFEDIYAMFEKKVGRSIRLWPLYLFTPWIKDALRVANPDTLKYCNLMNRGLVVLHVTRRRVHAEYHFVDTVRKKKYKNFCEAAFYVEVGDKKLYRTSRYLTVDGCIPHRSQPKRQVLVGKTQDVTGRNEQR